MEGERRTIAKDTCGVELLECVCGGAVGSAGWTEWAAAVSHSKAEERKDGEEEVKGVHFGKCWLRLRCVMVVEDCGGRSSCLKKRSHVKLLAILLSC